jgi:hypothetical protein
MAVESTQPLTEMSTSGTSFGGGGDKNWGGFNLLEPYGLAQACNGIDLPLGHTYLNIYTNV